MRLRRLLVASFAVGSLGLAQGCAARGAPTTEPAAPAEASAKKASSNRWIIVTVVVVVVGTLAFLAVVQRSDRVY